MPADIQVQTETALRNIVDTWNAEADRDPGDGDREYWLSQRIRALTGPMMDARRVLRQMDGAER